MKKKILNLFIALLLPILPTAAQHPIYVVNGRITDDIRGISPDDIETTEMLPADEETVARYGSAASNGVVLITLRYDTPARFPEADGSFDDYIARQVTWSDPLPAARVVLRYKILADGQTIPVRELETTDRRLRRRIVAAIEKAPRWQPAMRNGRPVESEGVLRIELPEGQTVPLPQEFVLP